MSNQHQDQDQDHDLEDPQLVCCQCSSNIHQCDFTSSQSTLLAAAATPRISEILRAREYVPKGLARWRSGGRINRFDNNLSARNRLFFKRKSCSDLPLSRRRSFSSRVVVDGEGGDSSNVVSDLPETAMSDILDSASGDENLIDFDVGYYSEVADDKIEYSLKEGDEDYLFKDWDISSCSSAETSTNPHRAYNVTGRRSSLSALTYRNRITPKRHAARHTSTDMIFRPRIHYEQKLSNLSAVRSRVGRGLPGLLREHAYDMTGHDKVFTSLWLNDDNVVLGTKCNKVVVINTRTNRKFFIPSFTSSELQELSSVRTTSKNASSQVSRSRTSPSRAIELPYSPGTWSWLRPMFSMNPLHNIHIPLAVSANPIAQQQQSRSSEGISPINLQHSQQQQQQQEQEPEREQRFPNCSGIHALGINPSKTLLAVGSGAPHDPIQLFNLPHITPRALLYGHADVVFAVDFVSDMVLASGSRDGGVYLWDIGKDGWSEGEKRSRTHIRDPKILCAGGGGGKVRDIKYSHTSGKLAALMPNRGIVKLWDVTRMGQHQLNTISTNSSSSATAANTAADIFGAQIELRHASEPVCLALDSSCGTSDFYAVGSEQHISFLDPRCAAGVVAQADSIDDGWGVRSVAFGHGRVVAVGGGKGRISFYDLRAQKYISWQTQHHQQQHQDHDVEQYTEHYHRVGSGWLREDSIYNGHFRGTRVFNAVYSLTYNQTGTSLFAAGGPLQLSLTGSYAGLWK